MVRDFIFLFRTRKHAERMVRLYYIISSSSLHCREIGYSGLWDTIILGNGYFVILPLNYGNNPYTS